MDVVSERCQTIGDRLYVDRSAECAGDVLIEGAIEYAHGQVLVDVVEPDPVGPPEGVLASSAKYGPDRNRPNSQTSSIITADVARSS